MNKAGLDDRLAVMARRLGDARRRRGWTLQQAAQEAELSLAYLSRIESGERHPSIATLLRLATAYGEPVGRWLDAGNEVPDDPIVRSDAAGAPDGAELTYAPLTATFPEAQLQAFDVTVPAGRTTPDPVHHPGEEWLRVTSGRLALEVDGHRWILEEGDVAHFDAARPHRLLPAGDEDVSVLLVARAASHALATLHS